MNLVWLILLLYYFTPVSTQMHRRLLSPNMPSDARTSVVFEGDIMLFECILQNDKDLTSDEFIVTVIQVS